MNIRVRVVFFHTTAEVGYAGSRPYTAFVPNDDLASRTGVVHHSEWGRESRHFLDKWTHGSNVHQLTGFA
ncbi:hypothetical protein CY34DRAFT_800322 [Suillus luteus UH-Slu-Lm8-n1]|uniref:Uncharacterized protein n=1 Tax=Suillus luteus UH-Slu-Lm8-n1 TaxID=930992 RepID=A0A0D0A8M3_9AGAM|nr:hypothetical protein CY34DRAFT_800322 [Suillus luteus UH-Slu-Lm8-n1]